MSYNLDLYANVESWKQAEDAAAATAAPGCLSVVTGVRKRWWRELPPSAHFDWREGQDALSDDSHWDEEAYTLTQEGRRRLAATVLALADVLPPGWGIRSYWVGDTLVREQVVTAPELAALVEQSRLHRGTLYRVGGPTL